MNYKEARSWPKVTVAVLSWNRFHYLKATLESARRCIQYPNIEWIVSDNLSEEEGLVEYIEGLDWVQKKIFKRQSHADSMNEIVNQAQGEFVVIWPDDVQFITEGPWLQDLVELLCDNPDIGSVTLDAQRLVTLKYNLQPTLLTWLPCAIRGLYLYGSKVRNARRLSSSNGFEARTAGGVMSGICGSGIPSLTRTDVWKALGPWKTRTAPKGSLVDSSMGAEENMYLQFIDSRLPLQTLFPMIPVAADIITDPLGCKAKVRGNRRYGVYMPPQKGGDLYYKIRKLEDFDAKGRAFPFSFAEMVEPIGFTIPVDNNGDRLKYPLNTSVVYNIQEQCNELYPLVPND